MLDEAEIERLATAIAAKVVEAIGARVDNVLDGDNGHDESESEGEGEITEEVTQVTTTRKRPPYVKRSPEEVAKLVTAYRKGGWDAVDEVARIWKQSKEGCRAIVQRHLKTEENQKKLAELTQ